MPASQILHRPKAGCPAVARSAASRAHRVDPKLHPIPYQHELPQNPAPPGAGYPLRSLTQALAQQAASALHDIKIPGVHTVIQSLMLFLP